METPEITNKDISQPQYWVPDCDSELKPFIGMSFGTLQEGIDFYKNYAHSVGFSVRLSSFKLKDQHISYRYVVCSKQGYTKPSQPVVAQSVVEVANDTSEVRKSSRKAKSNREGCDAHILLKRNFDGNYFVNRFVEFHTHELSTPSRVHMLRSLRNVDLMHKQLVMQNSRVNVGTSTTYRLISEMVGGREYVGCTLRDLENYKIGLKVLIKSYDAQMFIDNFSKKQEVDPGFYYAFEIGEDDKLKHVFWADSLCRRNYVLFGDLISFDSTYRTNKYSLVFTPFTGINHHRQLVCFGAGLISDEKTESFVWLFEKFLDAMFGRKPRVIVTDQDLAMKVAINKVFDGSVHRFCMWHILRKMSEKVGSALNKNQEFHKQLMNCVWNSETTQDFERDWMGMIEEFKLGEHNWFHDLFEMRAMWIPAYFVNIFLGGMLRTTSSSESENSFFNKFTNPNLSLVEFWMGFDHAMESQRHMERMEDNRNKTCYAKLKSDLAIEKHGREVYTHVNFYIFQEQLIDGCMHSAIQDMEKQGSNVFYKVVDNRSAKVYDVFFDNDITFGKCSCHLFESQGIPCCHLLLILKGKMMKELPETYILNRWRKNATKYVLDEFKVVDSSLKERYHNIKLSETWSQVFYCMHLATQSEEALDYLNNEMCLVQKKMASIVGDIDSSKQKDIQQFLGSTLPERVDIHPPDVSKNKGSRKRIRSGKEIAIEREEKNKRKCAYCLEIVDHDKRNCPKRLKDKDINELGDVISEAEG